MKLLKTLVPCLILAFVGLQHSANAQLTLGPSLGMNYTMIKDAYETFKPGASVGVLVNYMFNEDMAVALLPNYSMKGAKGSDGQEVNLNYFENQAVFKYYFKNKLNIFGGSYFGILASANATSNGSSEVDIKDQLKSADIGLIGGMGYDFGPGLGISINYLQGLSRINEEGDLRQRNIGFQFSIHYLFQVSGAK